MKDARGASGAGLIYKHFVSKRPDPQEGDLMVWWIPQIPGEPFLWPVGDLTQAGLLLDVLAAYDDFQFAHRVKGDYSNTGGLEVFRAGEWEDWYSEDGDDFDEVRRHPKDSPTSAACCATPCGSTGR